MPTKSIEKNLASIEQRLAAIEKKLLSPGHEPKSQAVSKKKLKTEPKPVSGIWLGIVATVCFIIAAGFIIKLTIVSGWLTHEKQLTIATLLGLALIMAGLFISSTDILYATFLPAAGSIILYITCFAAYEYYVLIAFQSVIVFVSFISAISIWFYVRFKHDIYAIIAAIGAYIAPLFAPIEINAIFSLYYFILCSLTFTTISILVKSRILTVVASYLAILITAFIGLSLHHNALIAFVLAINFLIFSIGTYFHTKITQQGLSIMEAWSLLPVLLIFYAMEFYFIYQIEPAYAPWVSLLAAAFLVILYLSAKKQSQLNSKFVLISFVTVVAYHSIYIELLPEPVKPWLFILIVLGWSFNYYKLKGFKMMWGFPIIALASILGVEYLNMLSSLVSTTNFSWALVSWASFASLWFVYFKHRKQLSQNNEYAYAILGSAHLLCIMALYQIANQYNSLAISASWLLYALIVLALAHSKKDVIMAKSVLLVLGFAAGKALLYDAAATPTIIRALSLIVTGIVLYTSGLTIRKMTRHA